MMPRKTKRDAIQKAREQLQALQAKAQESAKASRPKHKTYRVRRDSDGAIVASGVPYKFAHDVFWRYGGSADVIDEATGTKLPFVVLDSDLSPEEFGYGSSHAVMTTLRLAPIDLAPARVWIQHVHSHLDAPIGGKVAVAVERSVSELQRRAFAFLTKRPLPAPWSLCCVALLGRPVAPALQAQGCAEVSRVASDRTPHAASKALAAVTRAALALGYRRLVSFTLLGEPGTMYRAAGWRAVFCDRRVGAARGEWGARSGQPGGKVRWESGPDALPEDSEVAALVVEMTGKVPFRSRQESMPLFASRATVDDLPMLPDAVSGDRRDQKLRGGSV